MNPNLNDLDNIDYSYSFLRSFRWVTGLIIVFIFIILSYIPIMRTVDSMVYSGLSLGPTCQIRIKDYGFKFFAPKIVIENVHLPASCLGGKIPGGLKLDEVKVYLRGISFSPFGLSTKIATNILGNNIEAFVIPGFSSLSVLLESESSGGKFTTDINKISLNKLSSFIPVAKVSGDIYLSDIALTMGYNGNLEDLVVNIASNNINLPAQNLQIPGPFGVIPMSLDQMPINSLLIQVISLNGAKLGVKKFIIGDENAPIKARALGDIKLNMRNIGLSPLNLKTEVGFSKEFLEKFAIIETVLGQFDKKDNFYQIQLKGMLSSPKPSSAR